MYQIVWGSTQGLTDIEGFIASLDGISRDSGLEFDKTREVFVARAPGRLDLMGGIADYSGSLVLQLPLREAARVAVQREPSPDITIVSLSEGAREPRRFSARLADLLSDDGAVDYDRARDYFQHDPERHWAAYVAGAFLVLMRECGVRFTEGARILIDSSVPEGKGVSSSAALEVAAMQALSTAFERDLAPRELALLSQKVENLVVGAPCGVMDQMTAAAGEAGRLLALLCQPARIEGTAPIHGDTAVWGVDSGVRHFVSGGDYTPVRVGAFMGYRMICEIAGVRSRQSGAMVEIDDRRWHGYLANVTPAEYEAEFAGSLPIEMRGSEFLSRFGGISDPVTRVERDHVYPVKAATAHPIYEHARVRAFAALLAERTSESRLEQLGQLMYESHESYSACGLGSEGTDLLVSLVRQYGPGSGLYGAKITGGGSGGTVAILGRADAGESVKEVASEYQRRTGHRSYIFSGSSPGSARFGGLTLRHTS